MTNGNAFTVKQDKTIVGCQKSNEKFTILKFKDHNYIRPANVQDFALTPIGGNVQESELLTFSKFEPNNNA